MKKILIVFTLFILKSTPSICQGCKTFECAMQSSETHLKNKNHDEALLILDDAEDLAGNDEGKKIKIRSLRKRITAAMKQDKLDALKDKKIAVDAKNEAIASKNEAIASKLSANAREVFAIQGDQITALRLAEAATKIVEPPLEETVRSLHDIVSDRYNSTPIKVISCLRRFIQSSNINQCFFSKDGELFVTTSPEDSTLRFWKVKNGKNIANTKQLSLPVTNLIFSQNNEQIIIRENNGLIKVLNTDNGKKVFSFIDTFGIGFRNIIFFSNKPVFVYSNDNSNSVNFIDVTTNLKIKTFSEKSSVVSKCELSTNEKLMAILGNDNIVRIWDINKNSIMREIENTTNVNSISFSPNNNIIALARNKMIDLWDISSNKLVNRFGENLNRIGFIIFSDDGKYLVSAEDNTQTKLWSVAWGQNIQTINTNNSLPTSISITKDSRFIISYSSNEIKIWRTIVDMLDSEKNATLNEEQRKGYGVPDWVKD